MLITEKNIYNALALASDSSSSNPDDYLPFVDLWNTVATPYIYTSASDAIKDVCKDIEAAFYAGHFSTDFYIGAHYFYINGYEHLVGFDYPANSPIDLEELAKILYNRYWDDPVELLKIFKKLDQNFSEEWASEEDEDE